MFMRYFSGLAIFGKVAAVIDCLMLPSILS